MVALKWLFVSGVRYLQRTEFRSVLRLVCRGQKYVMYSVWGLGVRYVQRAKFRSALRTAASWENHMDRDNDLSYTQPATSLLPPLQQ